MGILKNQTAARLILQTNLNFTSISITSCAIKYIKPSGASGTWTAAKLIGGESLGKIYIDFTSSIKFDEAGTWTLSAYIVFTDTRIGVGDEISYRVGHGGEV